MQPVVVGMGVDLILVLETPLRIMKAQMTGSKLNRVGERMGKPVSSSICATGEENQNSMMQLEQGPESFL